MLLRFLYVTLFKAGRTDLVDQFQAKQKLSDTSRTTCQTPQNKRTKAQNKQSDNRKSKQCNIERKNKSHSVSQSVKPTDSVKIINKLAESDSDSWYSENESDHRHHVTMTTDKHVTDIDQWSDQEVRSEEERQCDIEPLIRDSLERMDKPEYCVEDVVNNALDDFLGTSSTVRRKTR